MKHSGPEYTLHCQVADFLDRALPADAWWTTFPAGGGGKVRGARLKRAGLKAGVPDLLVIARDGQAHWIELKAYTDLSQPQRGMRDTLIRAGCCWALARSVEGVERALISWGIPLRAKVAT